MVKEYEVQLKDPTGATQTFCVDGISAYSVKCELDRLLPKGSIVTRIKPNPVVIF